MAWTAFNYHFVYRNLINKNKLYIKGDLMLQMNTEEDK